jgi:hypothetical protein
MPLDWLIYLLEGAVLGGGVVAVVWSLTRLRERFAEQDRVYRELERRAAAQQASDLDERGGGA